MKRKRYQNKLNAWLFRRLKASSLVEVLVAIAVCMIVFTLSLTILLKSERENSVRLRLKAELMQVRLKQETEVSGYFPATDTIRVGGMVVCRLIQASGSDGMLEVTTSIESKNGSPLSIRKYLIVESTLTDEE